MIYFIRSINVFNPEDKKIIVKMGTSNNPDGRMDQLQTANHNILQIIEKIECAQSYTLENILHKKYKSNNITGEWFLFENEDELQESIQFSKLMATELNENKSDKKDNKSNTIIDVKVNVDNNIHKYICETCNYETIKYYNFKRHIESNKYKKKCKGVDVKQKEKNKSGEDINKTTKKVYNTYNKGIYICSHCEEQFTNRSKKFRHQQKCTGGEINRSDNNKIDLIPMPVPKIENLDTYYERLIDLINEKNKEIDEKNKQILNYQQQNTGLMKISENNLSIVNKSMNMIKYAKNYFKDALHYTKQKNEEVPKKPITKVTKDTNKNEEYDEKPKKVQKIRLISEEGSEKDEKPKKSQNK